MKSALRAALAISAFAVILTIASSINAQAPRVGGLKVVAVNDDTVVAAAEFAAEAQAEKTDSPIELIRVIKAERQIVQGSIYRLCVEVWASGAEDEPDVKTKVRATVYHDLKGNFKLNGWVEENCSRPVRTGT